VTRRARTGFSAGLAGAVLTLAFASPPFALAQSPDELLCRMTSEAAATANAAGPTPIDAMTTQERIDVICDTKTILTHFSRKDPAASQAAGWQDTWQEKLSKIYCDDPATRDIIAGGWTLAESTTFVDGVVFEIEAVCE
jgi:hypothetical protein